MPKYWIGYALVIYFGLIPILTVIVAVIYIKVKELIEPSQFEFMRKGRPNRKPDEEGE